MTEIYMLVRRQGCDYAAGKFSKLTVTVQPKENKIFGGFLVIILRVR